MHFFGNKERLKLLQEAVKHYRHDIQDFLENGVLDDSEPEYKTEVQMYRDLQRKALRLASMEDEISQILLNQ